MENRGAGLEISDDSFCFFELGFVQKVAFIEYDKIAEFNLVNNEGRNFFCGKIVLINLVVFAFFKVAEELPVDSVGINDCNN